MSMSQHFDELLYVQIWIVPQYWNHTFDNENPQQGANKMEIKKGKTSDEVSSRCHVFVKKKGVHLHPPRLQSQKKKTRASLQLNQKRTYLIIKLQMHQNYLDGVIMIKCPIDLLLTLRPESLSFLFFFLSPCLFFYFFLFFFPLNNLPWSWLEFNREWNKRKKEIKFQLIDKIFIHFVPLDLIRLFQ